MQQVSGPVVAIVLVLCAVFIPVSFLGGLAGELYRQFAVTIAVSVVISGIVALTLTPALGGVCPEAAARASHGAVPRLQPRLRLGDASASPPASAISCKRTSGRPGGRRGHAGAVGLLFQRVPGGLVPDEDQGYILLVTTLPPAASLDAHPRRSRRR